MKGNDTFVNKWFAPAEYSMKSVALLKAVVMVGAYCVGIMKSKQVSLLLSFLIKLLINLRWQIILQKSTSMELPVTWFGASYLKEQVLFWSKT